MKLSLRFAVFASLLFACAAPSGGEPSASSDDALTAQPSGSPAKYPIVLVHGFRASPQRNGFTGVAAALREDGHDVFEATLPPHDSSEVRARTLATELAPMVAKSGKVNVIAHSMGGLDARVLVSELGWGDRVASLTTISTPHRGSAFADAILGLVEDVDADDAINALADAYDSTYSDLSGGSDVRGAYTQLSEQYAPIFDAAKHDDPRVYYQSWAGVSNLFGIPNDADDEACGGVWFGGKHRTDVMSAKLALVAPIVAHGFEMRPNDGLVTVESAKWGVFRGCVSSDHLAEVAGSKFDHVRFYRTVAFELAAKGF